MVLFDLTLTKANVHNHTYKEQKTSLVWPHFSYLWYDLTPYNLHQHCKIGQLHKVSQYCIASYMICHGFVCLILYKNLSAFNLRVLILVFKFFGAMPLNPSSCSMLSF